MTRDILDILVHFDLRASQLAVTSFFFLSGNNGNFDLEKKQKNSIDINILFSVILIKIRSPIKDVVSSRVCLILVLSIIFVSWSVKKIVAIIV